MNGIYYFWKIVRIIIFVLVIIPIAHGWTSTFCRRIFSIGRSSAASREVATLFPKRKLFVFLKTKNLEEEEEEDEILLSPSGSTTTNTSCCCFPLFTSNPPPYLAIITESHACDSEESLQKTLSALKQAVSTGQVDLVSVRISSSSSYSPSEDLNQAAAARARRVRQLIQMLVEWSDEQDRNNSSAFAVVVSSAWMDDDAVKSLAHGVHFKESHRERIPELLLLNHMDSGDEDDGDNDGLTKRRRRPIVGTSCHSVDSALEAYDLKKYRQPPDYLFVGTCYPTASHPEKVLVEGPALPGQVRVALEKQEEEHQQKDMLLSPPSSSAQRPRVLAIGGIDASNCHEPIRQGAEGVAVIRAVLEASDPAQAVRTIQHHMHQALKK